MSLNIKNEHTHALVKRLALLTGQSQTKVVEDAVGRRLEELEHAHGLSAAQWSIVTAVVDEAHRRLTDEQKEALAHAEEDLYNQDGLPT